MKIVIFILNLPWTIVGVLYALLCIPVSFEIKNWAFVIRTKSLWFPGVVHNFRGARGLSMGQVVLVTPRATLIDIEHDLVHAEQHMRYPFIFPFLNTLESWRHGYQENRFEREAYRRAGNTYNNPYKS